MTVRTYNTTRSSIVFTLLILPFTLVFLVIGVACLINGVFNPLSVGFALIGALASYSALNYSKSRTTITSTGITKQNLLSGRREISWADVISWRYVEDSEAGIERVEIRTTSGKTIPFYVNEVENLGIESFIEDVKQHVADLELNTR